ncbi:MAG: HDOD domain-containing protein [Gammaproteobacteria bacterium]|nr:HDOD domain-containing protein [Gammaproteobacteria bacterium]
MFGFSKARERTAPTVNVDLLAGLRPLTGAPTSTLARLVASASTSQAASGLVALEDTPGRMDFLLRGNLQIQTRTGSMLLLKAGSRQACFPLPRANQVTSMFAIETCTLLHLPENELPAAPSLEAEAATTTSDGEAEALARLRDQLAGGNQELPSLPDLALKISQAIDSKDTSNDDIARLIQIDPALTARLLSVVNSSAFGGVSKITSVQQAVSRLGRNKVRSLVYSCLLKSIFKIQSPVLKKTMESLWQHSAHVAALSFVLGRQTPGIDPEQAMLAGLVHDIGAIAAIDGISRYSKLAENETSLKRAIDQLRVELGIKTLQHWGLCDEFGPVIRHAEDWHRIGSAIPDNADIVVLAQMHAMIGTPRMSTLPRISEIPAFDKLTNSEMTPRQSLNLLEEAAGEVREVHALISA